MYMIIENPHYATSRRWPTLHPKSIIVILIYLSPPPPIVEPLRCLSSQLVRFTARGGSAATVHRPSSVRPSVDGICSRIFCVQRFLLRRKTWRVSQNSGAYQFCTVSTLAASVGRTGSKPYSG